MTSPPMPCSTRWCPATSTPTSRPPTTWSWRWGEQSRQRAARAAGVQLHRKAGHRRAGARMGGGRDGALDAITDELRDPHRRARGRQPVERDGDQLFHSVQLLEPGGKIIGRYRQTHLDESTAQWATAGDDIPVFNTAIGRIGLLACDDVRFPKPPGCWRSAAPTSSPSRRPGTVATEVGCRSPRVCSPIPTPRTPWCSGTRSPSACRRTQSSNPVGQGYRDQRHLHHRAGDGRGRYGCVDGRHRGGHGVVPNHGQKDYWINQQILIAMRRADLVIPLTLPTDSPAFTRWHDAPASTSVPGRSTSGR